MDYILLEIDEIPGESTLTGHEAKIELMSFSHGVSLPMQFNPSTNGRTIGRCQHGDFTVSKQVDTSTPPLNLYCCQGQNIPKATIICARADGEAVLPIITYTLENCLVSSVSVSGGSGSSPMETVTFNYTKITWKVQAQNDSAEGEESNIEKVWDLNTNASNA